LEFLSSKQRYDSHINKLKQCKIKTPALNNGIETKLKDSQLFHCAFCKKDFDKKFNLERHLRSTSSGRTNFVSTLTVCYNKYRENENLANNQLNKNEKIKPHKNVTINKKNDEIKPTIINNNCQQIFIKYNNETS
jgi:hypothetical protein